MTERWRFAAGMLVVVAALMWLLWTLLDAVMRASILVAPPSFSLASNHASSFLLLCFGVGVLTMAFVQVTRTLIPLRGFFHRSEIKEWLTSDLPLGAVAGLSLGAFGEIRGALQLDRLSVDDAMAEFERRTGVPRVDRVNRFGRLLQAVWAPLMYDLPIEQLCGQLTVTYEGAMDNPSAFPNLLVCVTGPTGLEDLLTVIRAGRERLAVPPGTSSEKAMEEAQARARLIRMSQLRIDAFQIGSGGRWRRWLRAVVVGLSVVGSWGIIASSIPEKATEGTRLGYVIYSVLVGLISGYLAMFIRDMTAIVELRRRQS
jgi:hypothetical protein